MVQNNRKSEPGRAALERLYRGVAPTGRPLLFLDFDDVLCLNQPYSGHHLSLNAAERPGDLFQKLWHLPAVQALLQVVDEYAPQVVLTTSWLRLLEREGFVELFQRTGLSVLADALHEAWDAPQDFGRSRHQAIERWLFAHYESQPLLILDDELSGTGLFGSRLHKAGCVVLCKVDVGLHAGHLPAVRAALGGGR